MAINFVSSCPKSIENMQSTYWDSNRKELMSVRDYPYSCKYKAK